MTFNKNYNSNRGKLLLPEYGRNILQMIDSVKIIPDKTLRNKRAKEIIEVMGNINPTLRDSSDYRHKLWDHLFIIAEFDLDIDSPYPIPNKDSLDMAPQKLKYTQSYVSHRQYGKHIREIIKKLSSMDLPKEKQDEIIRNIAKFMKFKSYEFNQEFPSDEVVLNDVRGFVENGIKVEDNALDGSRIAYNRAPKIQRNSPKFSKSGKPQESSSKAPNKQNKKRFIPQKKNNG